MCFLSYPNPENIIFFSPLCHKSDSRREGREKVRGRIRTDEAENIEDTA